MSDKDEVPFGELGRQLGYRFVDPALLDQALSHRSVGSRNNERLEFLGDAFLGFAIARRLYARFGDLDEGVLSRTRASLVNQRALAAIARELDLGPKLKLGQGERKSGGWRRESILADTLEAIIGAILLDGGESAADAFIERLYRAKLEHLEPEQVAKDPKTRLQELMQARRLDLPVYELASTEGEPHERVFTVRCITSQLELDPMSASGASRRKAEQAAAAAVLEALEDKKN